MYVMARYISGLDITLPKCTMDSSVSDVRCHVASKNTYLAPDSSTLAPNVLVLNPDMTASLDDNILLEDIKRGNPLILSVVLIEVSLTNEVLEAALLAHTLARDPDGVRRSHSMIEDRYRPFFCTRTLWMYVRTARLKSLHIDMILLLLELNAEITPYHHFSEYTWWMRSDNALHVAAQRGLTDICRLLLEVQCDALVRGADYRTPLHYAALYGHKTCLAMLLEKVKNPFGENCVDDENRNVLHMGILSGNHEVCGCLLDASAAVLCNAQDLAAQTPLMMACDRNEIEMVCLLLRYTPTLCSIDRLSTNRRTTLHWACFSGHAEICRLLIAGNANVNATEGCLQRTCLHNAVLGVHPSREAIGYLLEARANVDMHDANGNSALSIARTRGIEDVVLLLEGAEG